MSGEPSGGLGRYQSVKRVLAGEVTEVTPTGCYVRDRDGSAVLRIYPKGMTARYVPVEGDWWMVAADGFESVLPREAFLDDYLPTDAPVS